MQQNERDDQILAHVALYRISFRRIIQRLFFGGEKACENVLDRLRLQRRLCTVPIRGGPLKYYQLTPEEAARRGVPHRALPIGGRALPEALGVLWFCFGGQEKRYRLERKELENLLGASPPHGPHCVQTGDPPRILRIYVPGARTKTATVASSIGALVETARQSENLAPWAANGLYGVAVLVPTEAHESRIRKALTERGIGDRNAIVIARTPDTHSLNEAVYALRAS